MDSNISRHPDFSSRYSNEKLLQLILQEEKAILKEGRYKHCLRVAETSRYMCYLYGQDPVKGYFAGLAHDLCKFLDDQEMISTALRDGNPLEDFEKNKPSLLHGRAAAVRLREDFGVEDTEILEAVALHTYGGENISCIAKIVFAADKIEPGREDVSDELRMQYFSMSLDEICLDIVKEEVTYLARKGRQMAGSTKLFLESLEASVRKSGV